MKNELNQCKYLKTRGWSNRLTHMTGQVKMDAKVNVNEVNLIDEWTGINVNSFKSMKGARKQEAGGREENVSINWTK